MKRQLVKGFLALNLFVMLAVSAAYAQSIEIVGKIPFQFVVGKTTLEAGEYTVKNVTSGSHALLIQSRDTDEGVFLLTTPVQARATHDKPKLVFTRYGERYFLSQIWPAGRVGAAVQKSAAERELAKARSMPDMVSLNASQRETSER